MVVCSRAIHVRRYDSGRPSSGIFCLPALHAIFLFSVIYMEKSSVFQKGVRNLSFVSVQSMCAYRDFWLPLERGSFPFSHDPRILADYVSCSRVSWALYIGGFAHTERVLHPMWEIRMTSSTLTVRSPMAGLPRPARVSVLSY